MRNDSDSENSPLKKNLLYAARSTAQLSSDAGAIAGKEPVILKGPAVATIH